MLLEGHYGDNNETPTMPATWLAAHHFLTNPAPGSLAKRNTRCYGRPWGFLPNPPHAAHGMRGFGQKPPKSQERMMGGAPPPVPPGSDGLQPGMRGWGSSERPCPLTFTTPDTLCT